MWRLAISPLLFIIGNKTVVYSREIVITIFKSTSTTESTVITNITDLDPITTVHWGNYTTVTSTIIGAGVIGGCSGGAVCCITVTLAVLFKKRRRKSKKSE